MVRQSCATAKCGFDEGWGLGPGRTAERSNRAQESGPTTVYTVVGQLGQRLSYLDDVVAAGLSDSMVLPTTSFTALAHRVTITKSFSQSIYTMLLPAPTN